MFRVLTIEGSKAETEADVDAMMALAQSLGVYDAVMRQIKDMVAN